jgi:hypothetical protein
LFFLKEEKPHQILLITYEASHEELLKREEESLEGGKNI